VLRLKELLVILAIGTVVFGLGKRIAVSFMSTDDLVRRRNLWFLLTIVAFLSPNFWIYAIVAIPLMVWTGRKDSNPGALYLMLMHVIPQIFVTIPMVGVSYLFDVDNYMMLSIFVLVPTMIRRKPEIMSPMPFQRTDFLLACYGVLQSFLYVHPEGRYGGLVEFTFTDALRKMFVFFLSVFVPYFVISRSGYPRRRLQELLACFCIGCAVMAAIAIFEGERRWLLYGDLASSWGISSPISAYLMRGSDLRAMASAGHSLALGYLLAIALGFWLYLQSHDRSKLSRLSVSALFLFGLIAAYSRGPWLGAVIIYFVFAALGKNAWKRLLQATAFAGIAILGLILSPLHEKVLSVLPFFGGGVDSQNILYRHHLFERAWELIMSHPLLGDQSALLEMQDLRQGQGIIDLVNSYLQVLLDNGFIGLSLFLGFMLVSLSEAWKARRTMGEIDVDRSQLGASLIACIIGTLIMIENASLGVGYERMFYGLAALAIAFSACRRFELSGAQWEGQHQLVTETKIHRAKTKSVIPSKEPKT